MDLPSSTRLENQSLWIRILSLIGRVLLAIGIPLIAFFVLYQGFLYLRDSDAPRGIIALVAIVWGVGGVALLYWVFNDLVERLPDAWRARLLPFVFVGPAMAILAWYLAIPTLRTFWISLFSRDGPPDGLGIMQLLTSDSFVGLQNYLAVFTEELMLQAFRNNVMWIIFGSTFSVAFGLVIATLADAVVESRQVLIFPHSLLALASSGTLFEYRPVNYHKLVC
jgi:alpha-glucoside transport system permease protein